jgi:hypothetical protein
MLVNLKHLYIPKTKINDISKLVKLKHLITNEYINNVDTLINVEKDISDIIFPGHIKEKIRLYE